MSKIRFVLNNFIDDASLSTRIDSNKIYINNTSFGSVTPITDGTVPTGFTINTLINGDADEAQQSIIESVSGVTLGGAYFLLYTPEENYYVWYNTGASNDPAIINTIGVEVSVLSGDDANTVAQKTREALSSILYINVYENGTFNNLNVENIKNVSKSNILRTYSNDNFIIEGNFPNKRAINSLIFGRHNFSLYTRYKIELFEYIDQLDTSKVFDSGFNLVHENEVGTDLVAWGDFDWGTVVWAYDSARDNVFTPASNLVYWLPRTVGNLSSFRITLSKNSLPVGFEILANSTTTFANTIYVFANSTYLIDAPEASTQYFETSRIFIGRYIEPRYNLSYGHTLSWEEDTQQYRTEGGTLRSDYSIPYRVFDFDMKTITESDRSKLQHEFRDIGLRKDFFMCIFPDEEGDRLLDYCGIVKLTKVPKFTEFTNLYYNTKYTIEEV